MRVLLPSLLIALCALPSVRYRLPSTLHKCLATTQQHCFVDNVPLAIERACYEMDTACLEVQFRRLQRQRGVGADVGARGGKPGKEGGRADAALLMAASLSPRRSPSRANTKQSPTYGGSGRRDRGGVGKLGAGRMGRAAARVGWGGDARSRLSGATANRAGGAAAVVAIVTKRGEVISGLADVGVLGWLAGAGW